MNATAFAAWDALQPREPLHAPAYDGPSLVEILADPKLI